MPELKLQTISIPRSKKAVDWKTTKWSNLPHEEMVALVKQLAGPRPQVPTDIVADEWSPQAIKVLKERYFLKNKNGEVIETVGEMCWRVAWEMASTEVKYGKKREQVMAIAREYYLLMLNRWFLPNSPTLMNAGKDNGLQYSACYVIPVEDSIEGIFDGIKYQAIVHKSGGGTGFSFSRLRPRGSRVLSTMGVSGGPVGFMRIYNAATQEIKQGGMRRGANMGILRVDHPDVLEFIHAKDDGVGITNFNVSVTITDKFMQALSRDEDYELVSPHTKEVAGKMSAKKIWDEIAESAWKTGDPGMVFIDRINQSSANPIRAEGWEVESTNPCVTGDTLVSTREGLKRIDELVGRTDVQLLIDTRLGEPQWLKATNIVQTGKKQVYRLLTKEGYRLRVTGDHRIRTNQGWKAAQDLVEGDKLWIANRGGAFGLEGTLEMGRVLGWLVGDGTLKATEAVLSFFGQEKQQLAPQFATMVDNLTVGMQRLNRAYPVGVRWIDERDEARVVSTRLHRLVDEYGLHKGEKLIVPEKVISGSEDIQKGFLQALFTADGHVEGSPEKGVSVRLTSTSDSLLADVQRLLLNFGIASQIFANRRNEGMRMMPDGHGGNKNYLCKAYNDLVISKDNLWKFAQEISFLVDYKNARLVDELKKYVRGPYQETYEATFDSLVLEGKEEVYDLTETTTHSFIANGFVVHNCGEQPLYPFDACNLGSIFLKYFVKDGQVDWAKLKESTHTAVRLLDSVIEMNPFPLPQIADTVKNIRRIGLGIGGWADMLVELGIPYDSQQALDLAEKVMKFINDEGHKESSLLALERGPFPMYKQSIYAKKPIRNSTVTTIAPTGSIGILADASGGCEPLFAVAYQHIVKSENRTLTFVNPTFEQIAKKRGFYSDELMAKVASHGTVREITEIPEDVRAAYGTAHEIHPDWHVKMQAAFQKYTDNGVSKTINLPNSATVDDVKRAYMMAWETGCMGITVFRDGCKSEQVLNLGTNTQPKAEVAKELPVIKPRPVKVEGATYKVPTHLGSAFITVNQDQDGNPFEVFVTIGKAGSEVSAMADALGRLISINLRFGNHLPAVERAREIMDQLRGIGGSSSVGFGPNKIRSLPDAVAKALGMHFGLIGYQQTETPAIPAVQQPLIAETHSNGHATQLDLAAAKKKDICPSCGDATLVFEEGCKKCYGCGYSEC